MNSEYIGIGIHIYKSQSFTMVPKLRNKVKLVRC